MRVVFLNVPAHGHTNPTLPVVAELVRRGHAVDYWSFPELRPAIERTGARFRAYPEVGDYARRQVTHNLFRLARVLLEVTEAVLPALVAAYADDRPDLLVRDSLAQWGRYLARIVGVPVASSVSTFVIDRRVLLRERSLLLYGMRQAAVASGDLLAVRRLGASLARRYGVAPPRGAEGFIARDPLNVVFTSRELQPLGDTFGPEYAFVGASLRDEPDGFAPPPDGRPLVYVSLGTLFNERPDFYRACFDAFADGRHRVVMAVGAATDAAALGPAPDNVVLLAWAPQLAVLRHAAAFVTHGGMNSVTEALAAGVPLVVSPQAHDQLVVAERVAELGAGVRLAGRVDAGRLRAAVDAVLADARYRERARALGATLLAAGGPTRAADALERYAGRSADPARERTG